MNVELAEERILLLPDKLGAQQSEGRAWSKRTDAFGAFAKLGGFLNKPKDEDYEVVYRELRLQPFWRLSASSTYVYERQRQHKLKVGVEVEAISLGEQKYPAANREVDRHRHRMLQRIHAARLAVRRHHQEGEPTLKSYIGLDAVPVTTEELNEKAKAGADHRTAASQGLDADPRGHQPGHPQDRSRPHHRREDADRRDRSLLPSRLRRSLQMAAEGSRR
jgi:hypothetical protein